MIKESSLKIRYLIKLVSNIVNGLINVVLVAIVPTALGTVAYGEFSYLFQFFSKFLGFFDASSSTAFFTKLSANRERKNLIGYYLIISLLIFIVSAFVVFISFQIDLKEELFPKITSNQTIYLALVFGFLTWFMQIYIKISDSYALTVSIEISKIIYKIGSMIALILIVEFLYLDLDIYLIFNSISIIFFLGIVSINFIKNRIFEKKSFQNIDFKNKNREFYKYISPLFLLNTLSIAIGFFQIWLLQKYGGSEESGFYGLAYQISAMSFLFTSAMTQIITREFSKSFGEQNFEEIKRLFLRFVPMLYSIASFFSIFILFQAENLILIFTDERFLEAIPVIMIMSFYPIHQTYGQISSSLFFATERTESYRNSGFIGVAISLFLSILLLYIFNFGAIGFAITMVVSQLIGTNIQLFLNSRFLDMSFGYLLKHQFFSVLFFISISFAVSFIEVSSTLYSFIFAGVIYTILTIVGILFFPKLFSVSLLKSIKV
jgi:O-antigen/teichoic acid export membrane protein